MKVNKIKKSLINTLLPKRMTPKLAVVDKIYTDAGKGTYSCDITILRTGDLEKTKKKYKEVPISPIWAGKNKQGIYCPLEKDIIVIINFIDWDEAFPYVDGVWTDQYETAEHPKEQFLITDGDKREIRIKKDFIIFKNDKLTMTYDMTSGAEKIEITDDANTNKFVMGKQGIKATTQNDTFDLSDLIELKNTAGSLKESLDDLWSELQTLNQNCATIATTGSPCSHNVVSAPFIAAVPNITSKKSKVATVFK